MDHNAAEVDDGLKNTAPDVPEYNPSKTLATVFTREFIPNNSNFLT